MNSQILFSAPSHIQIQGEQVLRFASIDQHVATYELVGFDHIPVIIKDYRPFGLDAINTLLMDKQLYDFAPKFNQPSDLLITQNEDRSVHIQLTETKNNNPPYMLWIAIGIEERLPHYKYILCETCPYGNSQQALFSVYKRPYRRHLTSLAHFSLEMDHSVVF